MVEGGFSILNNSYNNFSYTMNYVTTENYVALESTQTTYVYVVLLKTLTSFNFAHYTIERKTSKNVFQFMPQMVN